MKLIVAQNIGFCYGVKKSIESTYSLLKNYKNVCILGEIVHNLEVIQKLEAAGAREISDLNEIKNNEILVLRAHGSTKETYKELNERGFVPIEQKNVVMQNKFLDTACVFVKKIHNIVKAQNKDTNIIIFGDANHCEVVAIKSHCVGNCYVVKNIVELKSLINEKQLQNKKNCVVVQTTFFEDEFIQMQNELKKLCTNTTFFDTICTETKLRQREAAAIAQQCDLVLVLGSKTSSNTNKLLKICQKFTNAILIDSMLEVEKYNFKNFKTVGLVTGASAPLNLFMEVKRFVENVEDEIFDFEKELDRSFKKLRVGEYVKGIVTRVNQAELQLDIGFKYTGYISANEYSNTDVDLVNEVKCGQEIEAVVVKINDQDGSVQLSRKKFINKNAFEEIKTALYNSTTLCGRVFKIVDAGVMVFYKGIKVFIHNSQLGLARTENANVLLNKDVEFKVFSVDERRRSAKGSIRAAAAEKETALKNKGWETLEVGQTYSGKVKSITSFGLFVNVCGIDGLVHISDISWQKINTPSDVYSVGDEIEVTVKSIDRENNRLALTCKKEEDDPWLIFNNKFKLDDVVDTKIVSIKPFGAFAQIIPGVDGLIHISQLAKDYIKDISKSFKVRDIIKVKILEIDNENKKVKLSARALQENEPADQNT